MVETSALALLDPDRIEALGEDMRIIHRHRVHHPGLLVCSSILSAFERSTDTEGRWLDAQRTYEALGGPEAGKTSFRNQARKLLPILKRAAAPTAGPACQAGTDKPDPAHVAFMARAIG